MKNIVPQGLHMPSKGLYNYQKKTDYNRKPKTAENGNGGRRQKYNSLIQNTAPQNDGYQVGVSIKNSPP